MSPDSHVLPDIVPYEYYDAMPFADHVYTKLRNELQTRFGCDPDDPAHDPIKAIVLCYGIPTKIFDDNRSCSVDSALTALFEHTPWGASAIGKVGIIHDNPYCDGGGTSYLSRESPADFSEFRASSYNCGNAVAAPEFTVVRMIDDTHAVAGGGEGMLWHGSFSGGTWAWIPVADEDKDLVAYTVSDICAPSASAMYACSHRGTILKYNQSNNTWELRRRVIDSQTTAPLQELRQVSFYDEDNGWAVGKTLAGASPVIISTSDAGISWQNQSPPSSAVEARAVAAVDASHVWIATDQGIHFRSGSSWEHQSSAGTVVKMQMTYSGGSYVGWAVCSDGRILHTRDGQAWHEDTNPAQNGSFSDLAIWGSGRAVAAYGEGEFLRWHADAGDPDGGYWEVESSDGGTPKASVAVDSAGNVVAVGGKVVRWGRQSGGNLVWGGTDPIPDGHWRIRYLVCRVDGYAFPMVQELINGVPKDIPRDIRDMILRSVASDGQGSGKFVLDYKEPYALARSNLAAVPTVGEENIVYDESPDLYLTRQADVMGYYSPGSVHHPNANNFTAWGRPLNTWRPGGIGMFSTSFDAGTLRYPFLSFAPTSGTRVQSNLLRFTLPAGDPQNYAYSGHIVRLYDPATGNEVDTGQTRAFAANSLDIDYEDIVWPPSGQVYARLFFSSGDPLHSGGDQQVYRTKSGNIAAEQVATTGVTINFVGGHPQTAELIREGATGAAGNVNEPNEASFRHPYVFPRYASGFTWAEAAYLGSYALGWMGVAVGDPLMAPYATRPSVSITYPAESATVCGAVLIEASASANNEPNGIRKVEFWRVGPGQVTSFLGVDSMGPTYNCIFDTTAVSDGAYQIRAVAYENNVAGEASEDLCSVTVSNDSIALPAVAITQPIENGPPVSGDLDIIATVSSPPSPVSKIEFWMVHPTDLVLMATDYSPDPYSHPMNTFAYCDGSYTVRALAYCDGVGAFASTPRAFTIDNPLLVQFTAPAREGTVVLGSEVLLDVQADPSVEEVQYQISDPEGGRSPAQGQPGAGNSFLLDSTAYGDGAYTVYACAKRDGVFTCHAATRQIMISNDIPVCGTIVEARNRDLSNPAVSKLVTVGPKPVVGGVTTESMYQVFYIEEADRSAGIRIASDISVTPGDCCTVQGEVHDTACEREIIPSAICIAPGCTQIEPVYMPTRSVGGGSPDGFTPGVPDPPGPYNVGTLVRVVGKVASEETIPFVYVDDDGRQDLGIPVPSEALTPDVQLGDLVQVTGVSGFTDIPACPTPVLRARTLNDIVVLVPAGGEGRSGGQSLSLSRTPGPAPSVLSEVGPTLAEQIDLEAGNIGNALDLADGETVDLNGVLVTAAPETGVYALKEIMEPMPEQPRLVLALSTSPPELAEKLIQIDILQATLTTLPDGRRAVVNPSEVWVYTDPTGRPCGPMWMKPIGESTLSVWPWKRSVPF